ILLKGIAIVYQRSSSKEPQLFDVRNTRSRAHDNNSSCRGPVTVQLPSGASSAILRYFSIAHLNVFLGLLGTLGGAALGSSVARENTTGERAARPATMIHARRV